MQGGDVDVAAQEPKGLEVALLLVKEYTRLVEEQPLLRLLSSFNRMDMLRNPVGSNMAHCCCCRQP